MSNDILISVIVPVYNGEQFIDRAVQSVLCQMDGTVELILVNDGSTDSSGAICNGYAANHSNIRIVHQKNGGISSARNAGIAVASGEYLMFLDADDYLEQGTFEKICEVIRNHAPDCIDFGWRYISQGEPMPPAFHKLPKNKRLGKKELTELILPPLLNLKNDPDHFIFDFSWNKVYRKDIVLANCVAFDENRRTWEDRPFVVHYLKFCSTFYSMDQCFYNYVDVPGSLSRKYSVDFFRIIIENYKLYSGLYGNEYDFDTVYANNYWCHAVENMIYRSLEQPGNQEHIRKNIICTLQNEQVISWFQNRISNAGFEKTVNDLIAKGAFDAALAAYEKQDKRLKFKKQLNEAKIRTKYTILKTIGRL